jgi:hypothetical protein
MNFELVSKWIWLLKSYLSFLKIWCSCLRMVNFFLIVEPTILQSFVEIMQVLLQDSKSKVFEVNWLIPFPSKFVFCGWSNCLFLVWLFFLNLHMALFLHNYAYFLHVGFNFNIWLISNSTLVALVFFLTKSLPHSLLNYGLTFLVVDQEILDRQVGESMKKWASHTNVKVLYKDCIFHVAIFYWFILHFT